MDALDQNDGVTVGDFPLRFKIQWSDGVLPTTGVEASTGTIQIELGDEVVWPAHTDFQWPWIDLLEWLSKSWSQLNYEDGLPFRVDPPTAWDLQAHVERESKYSSGGEASELQIRLWEFLEGHDVGRALEGALAPSLILWREGRLGHALTDSQHYRCAWKDLQESLEALGTQISARLQESAGADLRARLAMTSWKQRDDIDPSELAAVTSGLHGDRLAPILHFVLGRVALQDPSVDAIARDEVLAAARMTSGLSTDVIATVIQHIERLGRGSSDRINEAAAAVRLPETANSAHPFEQGQALALALREQHHLVPAECFDPFGWLDDHGVFHDRVTLDTSSIDALACWGGTVGPAVLVNRRGKHAKSAAGRNSSAAHEICHLLVDRDGALPAAEVMGGRVNPVVEARAGAFAAEVLLPRSHAGSTLEGAETAQQARSRVTALGRSHRVSQEIVAWQARNSDANLAPPVFDYLRKLVGSPWLF